jgi:hypothetical protein
MRLRHTAEGKMGKAKGHAEDLADHVSKGADKVSNAAKGVKAGRKIGSHVRVE